MKQKLCSKCKTKKTDRNFYKNSLHRDGLSSRCKSCCRFHRKKYYQKHKERELALQKCWRENNPDYFQEWREKNPDKTRRYTQTSLNKHREKHKKRLRDWRSKNPEHIRNYNRRWVENNREHVRARYNEYRKKRYRNDLNFKLAYLVRTRLRLALRGGTKSKKSLEYLGCSIDYLKHYLEERFQLGMSWGNYGEWHIDHIRPLSSFDLTREDQLEEACHYTNLQPLWKKDNLCKGGSWELENDEQKK